MNKELFFNMFKNQDYVEQLKEIPQEFKVVHNEEKKTTNITIYGAIGNYWGESFSATDIDKALNEAKDNDIIVNLNSPGGDMFDGIAIFNRLKRHEQNVTIHVDGWACSAASVIAMAADQLIMELGSAMMIHEASSIVWGSKTDMRKQADVMQELENGVIDIYMTKANIKREEVREKVDAETWFSAKSAVEFGFADKAEGVQEEPDVTNNVRTNEERQSILNELSGILQPNNKTSKEPSTSTTSTVENKKGSFNLLKKWR